MSNELMQVGRNCLKSFTGLADPAHLCAMAEVLFDASSLLSEASEDGYEGGGMRAFTSVDSYLPFVACSIRRDGWLSRGAAYEQNRSGASTADLALTLGVFAKPTTSGRLEPTEKDYNVAAATIEFVAEYFEGKDVESLSDYENSLRVAMASGIVHPKFTGIIASAIQFYNKDVERRAKNEVWANMVANSRFQGTVGERSVFENLKVVAYRTWEGNFGATHFYSFVSPEGHAFTYFASKDMDLSVGQSVSLKASVKKHERYTPKFAGAPSYEQTVITRAALVTRAVVKSVETISKVETKVVKGPVYVKDGQEFCYWVDGAEHVPAVEETKTVKYNLYHFETVAGRKFLLTSKAAKKALVPGAEALVEFVEGWVGQGEQPVGLVK
jgi:hypothetical protein